MEQQLHLECLDLHLESPRPFWVLLLPFGLVEEAQHNQDLDLLCLHLGSLVLPRLHLEQVVALVVRSPLGFFVG